MEQSPSRKVRALDSCTMQIHYADMHSGGSFVHLLFSDMCIHELCTFCLQCTKMVHALQTYKLMRKCQSILSP